MTIRIVAIGGTVNADSATEHALRLATRPAADAGAEVRIFGGDYLGTLTHYRGTAHAVGAGGELVEAVRAADGLVIAAPGYHGTISGLVKNALDYLEDLSGDSRPYLDGRAVGLIATAHGDQAAMSTLITMRAIIHALRGWPTPMGVTIRTFEGLFDASGETRDERTARQLTLVGQQVLDGARALSRTLSS